MLHVGAPTVEDASQILTEILDLRHPLTFNQPLVELLKQRQKRQSMTPSCTTKQLGCYNGTLAYS